MKKRVLATLLIATSAFLALPSTSAYELTTHGALTLRAYERSVLAKDEQLLKDLGIKNGPNVFDEFYYDISGTSLIQRKQSAFENRFIKEDLGVEELSLPGWLMRGAIREDDVLTGANPKDDPYAWFRVFNHFYDPQQDIPLKIDLEIGAKAPAWGGGTRNPFTKPVIPDWGRDNHYSVFDAREAMYRALTGKDADGKDVATTEAERKKYWATTFWGVGSIVHLVQDMAQPQHTRNDVHYSGGKFDGSPGFMGHKSVYEAYIDASATGTPFTTIDHVTKTPPIDVTPISWSTLIGAQYEVPRFTDYVSFWTTRHEGDAVEKRRGLADYSNRGFFSAGTNKGSEHASKFPTTPEAPNKASVPYSWREQPISDPNLFVWKGDVSDSLTGEKVNVTLTTEGMWDQFLQERNQPPSYTLTRVNYDDQAKLLIPRAVAYSTGLIDYFFRGQLAAEDVEFTDTGIRLRIKNAIDVTKMPAWKDETLSAANTAGQAGKLVVAYEYKDSAGAKKVGASDVVDLTENIAPGKTSQTSYTFIFAPAIPAGAKEGKYRLVFRGKLGQEDDAVAVGAIAPVSGFLVTPNYTPIDGIAGTRAIYKKNNDWILGAESGLKAGNIDWKGWYVNGRATKVLSWRGPNGRSLPPGGVDESAFSTDIYQNGERFSVAPRLVLGAAISKDGDGKEWLVAICKDGHADVVYRRPNTKSDSPAFHDPVAAPDGWKQIGQFSGTNGLQNPETAWFFNNTGTEAQTLRSALRQPSGERFRIDYQDNGEFPKVPVQKVNKYHLDRLKVTLSNDSASFQSIKNDAVINNSDVTVTEVPECLENCDPATFPITCGCSDGTCIFEAPRGKFRHSRETVYTSQSSGEYVIGMDYDENGNELLATYQVNEAEEDRYTATSTWEWPICYVTGPHPRYNTDMVFNAKGATIHKYTSSMNNVLTINGAPITNAQDVRFSMESNTQSNRNPDFFERQQHLNEGRVSWSFFHYLDLRSKTLLSTDMHRDFSKPCPDLLTCVVYKSRDQVLLRHNGNEQKIGQETVKESVNAGLSFNPNWQTPVSHTGSQNVLTDDYIGTYVLSRPVWIPVIPPPPKPLYVEQNSAYPKPLYWDGFDGGIAVNADKDIALSMIYYDENDQELRFSYLTNGSLSQLLPGGGDASTYFPVYLLK